MKIKIMAEHILSAAVAVILTVCLDDPILALIISIPSIFLLQFLLKKIGQKINKDK